MIKFEIFGGEDCVYCQKAKQLLDEKGLPYDYFDIMKDFDAFDVLHDRIRRWETIPQIFYGERHLGGHDKLVQFLNEERM